jgi:hypothetical protein
VVFNGVGQADCSNLNPPIIVEDSGSAADEENISANEFFE